MVAPTGIDEILSLGARPSNLIFSGENLGWRVSVALPDLAVCFINFSSSYPDGIIPYKTNFVEPAGWWYLTARESNSTVRIRNFPIQGDVTVK